MRYVTVVGDHRSGKTTFCQLLSGIQPSASYCATIMTEHHIADDMVLHDTPGLFLDRMELYYGTTDVFVLLVRSDIDNNPWWERIHRVIPTAHWLLVCNGSESFKKCKEWAKENGIYFCVANLILGEGVDEAITILRSLCERHPQRIRRQTLTDVAYRWIQCV